MSELENRPRGCAILREHIRRGKDASYPCVPAHPPITTRGAAFVSTAGAAHSPTIHLTPRRPYGALPMVLSTLRRADRTAVHYRCSQHSTKGCDKELDKGHTSTSAFLRRAILYEALPSGAALFGELPSLPSPPHPFFPNLRAISSDTHYRGWTTKRGSSTRPSKQQWRPSTPVPVPLPHLSTSGTQPTDKLGPGGGGGQPLRDLQQHHRENWPRQQPSKPSFSCTTPLSPSRQGSSAKPPPPHNPQPQPVSTSHKPHNPSNLPRPTLTNLAPPHPGRGWRKKKH